MKNGPGSCGYLQAEERFSVCKKPRLFVGNNRLACFQTDLRWPDQCGDTRLILCSANLPETQEKILKRGPRRVKSVFQDCFLYVFKFSDKQFRRCQAPKHGSSPAPYRSDTG